MTLFVLLLVASVFSSILVVAAGILSSRVNRRERYVETYFESYNEVPGDVRPEPAE